MSKLNVSTLTVDDPTYVQYASAVAFTEQVIEAIAPNGAFTAPFQNDIDTVEPASNLSGRVTNNVPSSALVIMAGSCGQGSSANTIHDKSYSRGSDWTGFSSVHKANCSSEQSGSVLIFRRLHEWDDGTKIESKVCPYIIASDQVTIDLSGLFKKKKDPIVSDAGGGTWTIGQVGLSDSKNDPPIQPQFAASGARVSVYPYRVEGQGNNYVKIVPISLVYRCVAATRCGQTGIILPSLIYSVNPKVGQYTVTDVTSFLSVVDKFTNPTCLFDPLTAKTKIKDDVTLDGYPEALASLNEDIALNKTVPLYYEGITEHQVRTILDDVDDVAVLMPCYVLTNSGFADEIHDSVKFPKIGDIVVVAPDIVLQGLQPLFDYITSSKDQRGATFALYRALTGTNVHAVAACAGSVASIVWTRDLLKKTGVDVDAADVAVEKFEKWIETTGKDYFRNERTVIQLFANQVAFAMYVATADSGLMYLASASLRISQNNFVRVYKDSQFVKFGKAFETSPFKDWASPEFAQSFILGDENKSEEQSSQTTENSSSGKKASEFNINDLGKSRPGRPSDGRFAGIPIKPGQDSASNDDDASGDEKDAKEKEISWFDKIVLWFKQLFGG